MFVATFFYVSVGSKEEEDQKMQRFTLESRSRFADGRLGLHQRDLVKAHEGEIPPVGPEAGNRLL